jgi:hypothetical protein
VTAVDRRRLAEGRRQLQPLASLLARFDQLDGPLTSDDDEAEIARFMRLLSGPT